MALLAAVASTSGPVAASIPVAVRLTIVSESHYEQATARAYARFLSENGNFLIAGNHVAGAPRIYRSELIKCIDEQDDQAGCARRLLQPHEADREYPPVVVLVSRGDADGTQRWRCVGSADEDYWAERQSTELRLDKAMFGSPEEREAERAKAVECIFAAGTEAGGRVKIERR